MRLQTSNNVAADSKLNWKAGCYRYVSEPHRPTEGRTILQSDSAWGGSLELRHAGSIPDRRLQAEPPSFRHEVVVNDRGPWSAFLNLDGQLQWFPMVNSLNIRTTDAERVAFLFERYQALTSLLPATKAARGSRRTPTKAKPR